MIQGQIYTRIYKGFSIGSTVLLEAPSLNLLVNLIDTELEKKPRLLEGRSTLKTITLRETGPAVLKTYLRGGWTSRFNRKHYVRCGKTRSQRELEFISHARNAGVKAPIPIAYITRGKAVYQAWLVTEAIIPHTTFAALSLSHPQNAIDLLPEVSQNISLLVDARIYHVDLHPGNILITPNDGIHIVDFDKAHFFCGNRKNLIRKYKKRWTKATTKYGFHKSLSTIIPQSA